jgi:ABC-type Fe3+/spermidine/putrescine transport system ATPase subunit
LKSNGVTCLVATHDSTDALSFADETLVLQQGKIIDKGASYKLYNNPINKYVASLFGEVNELKASNLISLEEDEEDDTLLLYPHQLTVVDNGLLLAVVKQSYFKGGHYLIKAVFEKKVIFFEHDFPLELNQEVTLMIA